MNMYFQINSAFFILMAGIFTSACSDSHSDSEGRTLPSDEQVIVDVMPKDKDNVVGIYTTKRKNGEAYLNENDQVWYFDRGVVVKRKKKVAGAPNAVVVVSGLARYLLSGKSYTYRKFLVTDNSYEGIPKPKEKHLLEFVNTNLTRVFGIPGSITEIRSIDLIEDANWNWHTVNSFTVPFTVEYKKIVSAFTIEHRKDTFDIRFYRSDLNLPVNNFLATVESSENLGTKEYTTAEIKAMKTLSDGF